MTHLFTSESVTEGHPDKICDQISDAILDAIIAQDPQARVAVETLTTTGLILLAGEVSTQCYVDMPGIARNTLKEIGYTNPEYGIDSADCAVLSTIHEQSNNIALGIDGPQAKHGSLGSSQGAGDQGTMFGYACNETPELMPFPIMMAHKLTRCLAKVRKSGVLGWARPDGKSQVTVEYENGKPKRIDTVVIAVHHNPNVTQKKIFDDVMETVIQPVCGAYIDNRTTFHINATGLFVLGGPEADTGLTGRKIIVDTYGGSALHGGGCFSGKDPSKVDRSASYAARYIAKNIVAAHLADRCQVQLAYSIGVAHPVSLSLETFGTAALSHEDLLALVQQHFPLTPGAIIQKLDMLRPIYQKTASYGHFGRSEEEFTWERVDMAERLVG